jgi:hypothetical protein
MCIILRRVEGNKFEAWLVDEANGIHVFLGYHFEYTNLPLAQIQANLEQGMLSVFKTITNSMNEVVQVGS